MQTITRKLKTEDKTGKTSAAYIKGKSLIYPISKGLLKIENILISKWVQL